MTLAARTLAFVVTTAMLVACGDDGVGGTETNASTSSSSTSSGTTMVGSTSSTTTDDSTSSSSSSGSSSSSTGPLCDPFIMQGDVCDMDCECLSGSCFTVPLVGGSCGECKVDDDCPDGGCTIPNPWGGEGSMCNAGEPGKGCETDEVCADPGHPYCATLIEAPGLFALMTCSECRTDDDCADPTPHCVADLDLDSFTGLLHCAADGTLQQNQPCQKPDQLDAACASGICSLADVMGVLDVGICGECLTDADCNGGTCMEASVDLGGNGIDDLFGSVCV